MKEMLPTLKFCLIKESERNAIMFTIETVKLAYKYIRLTVIIM